MVKVFDSFLVSFQADTDESNIQYANGSDKVIQVHYNGEWRSVCGNGWSNEDAKVACRQLNEYSPQC